jgi:fibronectin type 3 domain-containing protein
MVLVRKIFTPKKESTMKTTRFLTLAAIYIALALILFACSSDSGGGGSDDNQTIAIEDPPAWGASPAGVVAFAISNAICVNFGAVSDADGYYIYRSSYLYLQMNLLDTLKTSSQYNSIPTYCDDNVEAGRTYYYRVAAFSGNGTSRALIGSQSSIASATMAPNAPTGVTATATSTSSISIYCGGASGATSYHIYRGGNYLVGIIETGSIKFSCHFEDTGLGEGNTYEYTVTAINSGGSTAAQPVSARTWTVPSAPQDLVATPGYAGAMLSWSAPEDNGGMVITKYQISTNNGTTWLDTEGKSSASFYLDNSETSHYVMVRAVNSVGPGYENGIYIDLLPFGTVNIDGQDYKTVVIGSKTWTAEPINGRNNYNWALAMDIDASYNSTLWDGSDVNHQGICPSGWHIPSKAEWEALNEVENVGLYFSSGGYGISATQYNATNFYMGSIIGNNNQSKSSLSYPVHCIKN